MDQTKIRMMSLNLRNVLSCKNGHFYNWTEERKKAKGMYNAIRFPNKVFPLNSHHGVSTSGLYTWEDIVFPSIKGSRWKLLSSK